MPSLQVTANKNVCHYEWVISLNNDSPLILNEHCFVWSSHYKSIFSFQYNNMETLKNDCMMRFIKQNHAEYLIIIIHQKRYQMENRLFNKISLCRSEFVFLYLLSEQWFLANFASKIMILNLYAKFNSMFWHQKKSFQHYINISEFEGLSNLYSCSIQVSPL